MLFRSWKVLADKPRAVLVDTRTSAEWTYVGVPDLKGLGREPLLVSWKLFPDMRPNPDFARHLTAAVPDTGTALLFICRSGKRSLAAAIAIAALGYGRCYNVTTGFEGDKDPAGHRGTVSGWKVDGLPWTQG